MDSGFEAFFRQIPLGLVVMFCGSGALLFGAIGFITWQRGQRRRDRKQSETIFPSPGYVPAQVNPSYTEPYPIFERQSPTMTQPNIIPPSDADDMPPYNTDYDDDLPDLESLSHPAAPPTPPTAMAHAYTMPSAEAHIDPETIVPGEARPTTGYRVVLANGETTDTIEILTVLRDIADGSLIIQIGEQLHRYPPVNADADFTRRLSGVLNALTGASISIPAQPPAYPLAAAPLPLTPPRPGATPGDLPKFRLEDLPPMQPRRNRNAPKVDIPQINVGSAIETFLQHKRGVNGDFPGRAIHVRSGVGGSIVIEVDGQFFESVGDVGDADVRAYLQDTIAEWQSRQ
ncbi:MAG: hypothetical protein SGJ24_16245 [Chloroflexota bacterium]|nr:hypothetical protein [Chloroflexota bacterium]